MAIPVAFVNAPIGFVDVNNLSSAWFKPAYSPYREVFLQYLQQQLHYFNRVYEKKPEAVLEFIEVVKAIYSPTDSTCIPNEIYSSSIELQNRNRSTPVTCLKTLIEKIFMIHLLGQPPARTESNNAIAGNISLVKEESFSRKRHVFKSITTTLSLMSIGGYIWSAGQTVKQVVPDAARGYLIGGSVCLAFLSLCSLAGLSYYAGKEVGSRFQAGNVSAAEAIAPKMNCLLKAIVGLLAVGSGGSNFTVNQDFIDQFLTENGQHILATGYGTTGLVGASIVNYYYSAKLVDEVLVFCAKHKTPKSATS